jgi:hypothetical protein
MPSVTFIDNPNAPGAKMEMDRLRRENSELKRRLEGGGASSSYVEPELTEQQLAEQPRSFTSGNCTITIVPLSQLPPLKMNPDFGGIVIRGQAEIAKARVGKAKAPQIAATSQTVKPAPSYAADEEDEAVQRFALLELDK